nr:hypothetical protein [Desulfobulbaceae bacterium]
MSRPFRAICTIPVPRALPWAGMFWPFQGYLYYSSPQGVALGWYVLALSGQTEYLQV